MANSSPILNFQDRRVECRTYAVPTSSSLAWMRTWEPTAIGLGASTSTPDELMLSTRPWIIFLRVSSPCDTFTGQQMGMRSESLASPVPIGFVAVTSSFCKLVQERLIEMFSLAMNSIQLHCRWKPGHASIGQSPVGLHRQLTDTNTPTHRR